MLRLIVTDDAFHGGEPMPDPRCVRVSAHAPARGGDLYTRIPTVADRPHSSIRDEAARPHSLLPGPAAPLSTEVASASAPAGEPPGMRR